jgi:hypothetical protein
MYDMKSMGMGKTKESKSQEDSKQEDWLREK